MSKETVVNVRTEMEAYVDDLKKVEDKIARLLASFIKEDLGRSNNPENALRTMLSVVPEALQKDVLISAITNLAGTLNSGSGNASRGKSSQKFMSNPNGFWG